MNRSVQQLKHSLQTLALPVTAQLRLHAGDRCNVEELVSTFDIWQQKVRRELNESLTGEQVEVLDRLDGKLLQLTGLGNVPAWSDNSLRQSSDWRQVRALAREALAKFNWPLDVPPPTHG